MKRKKHPSFNLQPLTSNHDEPAAWEFNEGAGRNRKFDLEDRPLEFASAIIDLSESLPATRAGDHIAGQILRSGTSPHPNHGEAEAAEPRDDFIHKLKVCLNELRETRRWARLIKRKAWVKNETTLLFVLKECEDLIRIFHASIRTARRNAQTEAHHSSGEAGGCLDVGR